MRDSDSWMLDQMLIQLLDCMLIGWTKFCQQKLRSRQKHVDKHRDTQLYALIGEVILVNPVTLKKREVFRKNNLWSCQYSTHPSTHVSTAPTSTADITATETEIVTRQRQRQRQQHAEKKEVKPEEMSHKTDGMRLVVGLLVVFRENLSSGLELTFACSKKIKNAFIRA